MLGVRSLCLALLATIAATQDSPVVTLPHGGKIEGSSVVSQQIHIDLFTGVRYAQAPIGALRFARPVEVPPWQDTLEAKKLGNSCPQADIRDEDKRIIGNEDCLMMDIYVPGGVGNSTNKAVMVWIHGGGFYLGSGLGHPAGPMSAIGDVIVVTVNYRLGPLGFLSDGLGTGNFGLWDQRAALLWVQKNIAAFGGDPDMVTIFGESAGGASVSALTISPQTDGLFNRAITQSGSALLYWSILRSKNDLYKLNQVIRKENSCRQSESIYDCMRDLPLDQVLKYVDEDNYMFHLVPDGEFLPQDLIETQSYNLSQRFDLLAGMNGQEGIILFAFDVTAFVGKMTNTSVVLENGIEEQEMKAYLLSRCELWITKLSPELCVDFLVNTYKLTEEGISDRERTKRLVEVLGEHHFNVDIVDNIEQQSTSTDHTTYAYYFTEAYKPAEPLWPVPDWLKYSANHGDELPFVFGSPFLNDANEPDIWKDMTELDKLVGAFLLTGEEPQKELSRTMITIWSNFAKSGNPNSPEALPVGIPLWPEFDMTSMQFMDINSTECRLVDTPNKNRLDRVRDVLFSARRLQLLADNPSIIECQTPKNKEVTSAALNQAYHKLLTPITIILHLIWRSS